MKSPRPKNALLRAYLSMALESIRAQMLRTVLTVLIIAFGIMALVGILTSTDALAGSIERQFALMGSHTFTVQNRGPQIWINGRGTQSKPNPIVTLDQAEEFRNRLTPEVGLGSISFWATGTAELKSAYGKTNPNVRVWGIDERYFETGGYEVEKGRGLSVYEVDRGTPVAVVGKDVVSKLFKSRDPLGKTLKVAGRPVLIVGVLSSKGDGIGMGGDNAIFLSYKLANAIFPYPGRTYSISVMAPDANTIETSVAEATALMRAVRRLSPRKEENFAITRSNQISEKLIEDLKVVNLIAFFIGGITLLGSSIALMNIMLVSVTERTREIGTRKAMGARSEAIRYQFLTEAVVICQIGGLVGAVLGIAIGNGVAAMVGGQFTIPWNWLGVSLILCFGVGLASGLYPALKASKLDPIEALRYE
ncbi:FtsX-like permease family protein [bacterium]|nr:FtsX-like permease family protein [bacterium]